MRFSIIQGDGTSSRPERHLETLVRTTGAIEHCVATGRIMAARIAARPLTAIERGVITTRMLRDGFRPEQVLAVLG